MLASPTKLVRLSSVSVRIRKAAARSRAAASWRSLSSRSTALNSVPPGTNNGASTISASAIVVFEPRPLDSATSPTNRATKLLELLIA